MEKKKYYRKKHSLQHMCICIEGILKRRNKIKFFSDAETGRPLSDAEARAHLKIARNEGKRVIPIGDCYRFDYKDKGCLGHIISLMPSDEKMAEIEAEYKAQLK